MQDSLLTADERLYLRLGIQLHTIPATVEVGHGVPQLRCSHGGLIAVGIGVVGHLA